MHSTGAFLLLLLLLALAAGCAAPSPAAPPAAPAKPPPGAAPSPPAGAGPSPAPLPAAPEAIEAGFTAVTASYWAVYVAQARGYFDEQAIAMNENSTGSAAAGALALVSGSLDLVASNPDPLIRSVVGGSEIVMVGGTLNPPSYGLYSSKNITTVAGLRGQTLIIGGPKDVTAYLLDRMLEPNGLRPGDYDLVYAGGTPDRLRALQSGAVQGALLTQPFDFAARREGYPLLLDSTQYVKNLPFSAFAVTRAWLASEPNRARLVRWLAAVYRASQELCDPAQKEAMARILADKTRLSEEDARQTYDLLILEKRSVKCDVRLTADELQKVIDYIVEMGDLAPPLPDPQRLVDPSYLDQAVARPHQ